MHKYQAGMTTALGYQADHLGSIVENTGRTSMISGASSTASLMGGPGPDLDKLTLHFWRRCSDSCLQHCIIGPVCHGKAAG